jgi:hypothetical protein
MRQLDNQKMSIAEIERQDARRERPADVSEEKTARIRVSES